MSSAAITRPPLLTNIYLRAALGAVTKKHSLSPEITRLEAGAIAPENLYFTLNRVHIRQFRRVIDDNVSANLQSNVHQVAPLTYLQCILNCLPMNQLTHPNFPLNIVGSVHESIAITSHYPIPHDATTVPLRAHCHIEPEIQRSDKDDWIFSIVTRVEDDSHYDHNDDNVDDAPHPPPLPIMTITNQYRILNPQRHKSSNKTLQQEEPASTDLASSPISVSELLLSAPAPTTTTPDYFQDATWQKLAQWKFSEDAGRRYAALNGDINPIHMHPLSAKLFGYRSCIAHGMHSVCKVWSVVETMPFMIHAQQPASLSWDIVDDDKDHDNQNDNDNQETDISEITLTARFLRPTLLPNPEVVAFWRATSDHGDADDDVDAARTRDHDVATMKSNQSYEYVIGTRHHPKEDDTFKETIRGTIEIVRKNKTGS